jgi:hypothetical protein
MIDDLHGMAALMGVDDSTADDLLDQILEALPPETASNLLRDGRPRGRRQGGDRPRPLQSDLEPVGPGSRGGITIEFLAPVWDKYPRTLEKRQLAQWKKKMGISDLEVKPFFYDYNYYIASGKRFYRRWVAYVPDGDDELVERLAASGKCFRLIREPGWTAKPPAGERTLS